MQFSVQQSILDECCAKNGYRIISTDLLVIFMLRLIRLGDNKTKKVWNARKYVSFKVEEEASKEIKFSRKFKNNLDQLSYDTANSS